MIEQAIELWSHLGDRRYWEASSVVQSMLIAHHEGDFTRSAQISTDIYASGHRSGNAQALSWGLLGQAENALRLGQIEEAVAHLEAVEALIAKNIGRAEEIRIYGLLALARVRQGELAQAQPLAEKAARLIAQSSPTTYYSLEGYAAVAEVFLTLWEAKQHHSTERIRLKQLAGQSCAALRKFARIFSIAQPRALLWQGRWEWLAGHSAKAHKRWQKSLAAAERLAMPYEQRLVRDEIARRTAGDER